VASLGTPLLVRRSGPLQLIYSKINPLINLSIPPSSLAWNMSIYFSSTTLSLFCVAISLYKCRAFSASATRESSSSPALSFHIPVIIHERAYRQRLTFSTAVRSNWLQVNFSGLWVNPGALQELVFVHDRSMIFST